MEKDCVEKDCVEKDCMEKDCMEKDSMEKKFMQKDGRIDAKYIDVLDGIRAISIIIVLIFHFWQQTWIWPSINTPWLSFIGISKLSFNNYAKVGYVFVDMMVLISGFLLFLPVARQILLGESMDSWKRYARKRIARIVPSYLVCVIVLFIYSVSLNKYANAAVAVKDLLTHLTFTQTLFRETYLSTKLNVVLWTVAIEVWFYILYPFIASFIKRRSDGRRAVGFSIIKMAIVVVVMYLLFYLYAKELVFKEGVYLSMTINQLPAFFGVYANGMIGALIFVAIAKKLERTPVIAYVSLIIAVFSIIAIDKMVHSIASVSGDEAQIWQVANRTLLSLVFVTLIISLALSPKWIRWLFSNRLMRFLAGISYNLYIWHQWLAVEIKNTWRIPPWSGDTPPNQLYNMDWMKKYAAIITVAAFVAAVLATYLIEKPCANLILGRPAFGKRKARDAKPILTVDERTMLDKSEEHDRAEELDKQ